jgi:hypothetical protein
MYDLMQHLDFVRTYLDNILVISSGTLDDHLKKMEVVFKLLSDKGLRLKAEISNFCVEGIEYLEGTGSVSQVYNLSRKR